MTDRHHPQYLRITVAIVVPLHRSFDYVCELPSVIEPTPGLRVAVPFGKQQKIGIIVAVSPEPIGQEVVEKEKLKSIHRVIDHRPPIPEQIIRLWHWFKKYYHAADGEIWQTLLPNDLLRGEADQIKRQSRWQITPSGKTALVEGKVRARAVQQLNGLRRLADAESGIAHTDLSEFGLKSAVLQKLAEKGWAERISEKKESLPARLIHDNDKKTLNPEQQQAVLAVTQALAGYQGFLLQGVTASGKTEVYLQVIESVLKAGKQALVLVPEIGLTPQTLARFQRRFRVPVVVIHSAMTDSQRLQSWLKAREGEAPIIIGTRSALFAPLSKPGIIIVDEEHDRSFRQQQGVRYSARDLALVRAHQLNIPVLLGSATPSLETLANVHQGKLVRLQLKQKALTSQEPKFTIIDLKKQPMIEGLAADLVAAIKQHLQAGGQILLFLNRRGFAPVYLCHDCGWSGECQRCELKYTYHQQNHFLECHHCGSSKRAPRRCPQCEGEQLVAVGMGTERLEALTARLFPDARVCRIDRDTTRRKQAMQDYLQEIRAGQVDILIGTQMLAKGHHFKNLTLVALVDMDGALYSADFRAPELAAQLITQVAGRTGRAEKAGEVIIQTHLADHPMLRQLIEQGYDAFASSALREREETQLPPYTYQALIHAEAPRLENAKHFLQDVAGLLNRYQALGVEQYGPAPALYSKKAGKFRYQLWLQSNRRTALHRLIELTLADIESLKSSRRVRWRLEIDPIGE